MRIAILAVVLAAAASFRPASSEPRAAGAGASAAVRPVAGVDRAAVGGSDLVAWTPGPHGHGSGPDPRAASPRDTIGPSTVVEGNLHFHFWPGGEALARQLAGAARTMPALPALPPDILDAGDPVAIYLAPDPARFDSLTDGRAPEWGAGVAMPVAGIIVLPAYGSRRGAPHGLTRVLRHELAHIALGRHLAPARVPRWFDEGYARWVAGEWDWEAAWQLRIAFALHRAPPLDSLSLDWPRAEADARIAYLLATSAVAFLVEHGGEDGLAFFLRRWQDSGSFDAALRDTYGRTVSQFEAEWSRVVKRRYGWLFVLSHSLVFWAFGAGLILILFGIRRRRDRSRLERLRATELPDEPAYWLESDDAHGREPRESVEEPRPAGGYGRPGPTAGSDSDPWVANRADDARDPRSADPTDRAAADRPRTPPPVDERGENP